MKALLTGAGMALAAGLTMGFAMQPQLGVGDERPEGPQLFAATTAERSTGPFDPGTSYSYGSQLPDYVVGTDWKKAAAVPAEAATPQPAHEAIELASYEVPRAPGPANNPEPEPEPAQASYPSLAGGKPYGADAPAPRETPSPDDDAPVIIR